MASEKDDNRDECALEGRLRKWASEASEASAYRRDEALSKRSSLRIGGRASHWIEVGRAQDLKGLLEALGDEAFVVVGLGSNALFPDAGIEAPVVKFVDEMASWDIEGDGEEVGVRAGAGAINAHLVRGVLKQGYVGAEFLKLIPGTIGGAVALNAGTKEAELKEILETAKLYVPEGDGWVLKTVDAAALEMGYRHCALPERAVVAEVVLRVEKGDVESARDAMRRDWERRDRTQPYRLASVGSTFANPKGDYAGRLIDEAGLKGRSIGGAHISEKHGNFFINDGDATSDDFLKLMALARHEVRKRFGVELRPEVKFVGFDGEEQMERFEKEWERRSRDLVVGVLTGGESAEREISLQTGEAFEKALVEVGYDVKVYDVAVDLGDLAADPPDVALLGVHGGLGESGALQGFLESLGVAYTGSGVLASALAMDKTRARELAQASGVPVAPGRSLRSVEGIDIEAQTQQWVDHLGLPMVVKLNDSGSSVGVELCETAAEVKKAIEALGSGMGKAPSAGLLAERFVSGPEFTVGFFDEECLGVMEIEAQAQFYDYEAKYESGTTDYRWVDDEAIAAPLIEWAERTVEALGCRGVCRVDFKGDPRSDAGAVMLEVNTIPGMTATSLVPKLAAHQGLAFSDFVEAMVSAARLDVG